MANIGTNVSQELRPGLSPGHVRQAIVDVFVCFFNVVTQQAFVRGYIFQELWEKYGPWVATIVTTVLFLALHAVAISQGVQGLIGGANILLASQLVSLAYVRTGALWLAIGIAHRGLVIRTDRAASTVEPCAWCKRPRSVWNRFGPLASAQLEKCPIAARFSLSS